MLRSPGLLNLKEKNLREKALRAKKTQRLVFGF